MTWIGQREGYLAIGAYTSDFDEWTECSIATTKNDTFSVRVSRNGSPLTNITVNIGVIWVVPGVQN